MKAQAALLLALMCGCSKSLVVTPGTPRSVAEQAAEAYRAAGHDCQIRSELAYCDTTTGGLPLLMGYNATRHELLFATVYDTEAAFGRTCPNTPAKDIQRPEWMTVKCDEIEFDDRTKKLVLSLLGGGRIPDEGLSRGELNRSVGLFMHEAEGYLVRLKAGMTAAASVEEAPTEYDVKSTKL